MVRGCYIGGGSGGVYNADRWMSEGPGKKDARYDEGGATITRRELATTGLAAGCRAGRERMSEPERRAACAHRRHVQADARRAGRRR
jgi:hypothetical protein